MGPGPLQRAVDRGGRGFQQLGNLGGAELHDIAQNQHGPLTHRKFLQGRHHGQPNTLFDGEGVFRRFEHQRVGDRLKPVMGPAVSVETGIRVDRSVPTPAGSTRRPRFCSARRHVVRGDPVQPRPQRRAFFECLVPAPGAQVGFLHQILSVMHRTEHPIAVRNQLGTKRRSLLHELLLSRHCQAPISARTETLHLYRDNRRRKFIARRP